MEPSNLPYISPQAFRTLQQTTKSAGGEELKFTNLVF